MFTNFLISFLFFMLHNFIFFPVVTLKFLFLPYFINKKRNSIFLHFKFVQKKRKKKQSLNKITAIKDGRLKVESWILGVEVPGSKPSCAGVLRIFFFFAWERVNSYIGLGLRGRSIQHVLLPKLASCAGILTRAISPLFLYKL